MRGQATLEFLILTVGLLAIYSFLLPHFLNSVSTGITNFNAGAGNFITQHIAWKSREVNLLEEGDELTSSVYSPVEFRLFFENGIINSQFNSSIESSVVDGELFITRGRNELSFVKTPVGVEVQSLEVD